MDLHAAGLSLHLNLLPVMGRGKVVLVFNIFLTYRQVVPDFCNLPTGLT